MSENPHGLSNGAMSLLISEGNCPNCLFRLQVDLKCSNCGLDNKPWIEASRARNERAHNNREG